MITLPIWSFGIFVLLCAFIGYQIGELIHVYKRYKKTKKAIDNFRKWY